VVGRTGAANVELRLATQEDWKKSLYPNWNAIKFPASRQASTPKLQQSFATQDRNLNPGAPGRAKWKINQRRGKLSSWDRLT